MRADEKNRWTDAANFHFDIVTGSSMQFISVAPRLQTGTGKRILDEIGSGIELWIARHIPFADLPAKDLNIGH